jgi:hypothetical protein
MKLAVGINFSFSSSLSKVVDVRALLVGKTLSAVEGNLCEAGLAGSAESMLCVIRCGIHAVGVWDGDSPFHEEGTGLEAIRSSPM